MGSMVGRWFAGAVVMSGAFLAGARPAWAEEVVAARSAALAEVSRRIDRPQLWADAGASGGAADGARASAEERVEKLSGALEDLKKALQLKPSKGERKEIMEAMKTLKKQLAAAKKALKAEGGAAAASGAASSSAAEAGACAQGMVKGPDTAGNCCWPGQEWSVRKDRCLGVPTCPEGLQADGDGCAAPRQECAHGQVANADTSNHCCWPGQEWSKGKSRCIGAPECPGDLQVKGEECRDAAKDAAARAAREAAEEAARGAKAEREANEAAARVRDAQEKAQRAEALERELKAPGMMKVPGGTYVMGESKTSVTVAPFWLDEMPVTAAAYAACEASGKCSRAERGSRSTVGETGKEDHPANYVDWEQAKTYCAAKGRRLPSEAEREWAARSGEKGWVYPWGDEEPGSRACWAGEGNDLGKGNRKGTCAVGSFPSGKSLHGVKDLAGNVWEWTSSVYEDGKAWRVARGGSWAYDLPQLLRASYRGRFYPRFRFFSLGFRCALTQ